MNDGIFLGDFDSQAEMSVRLREGDFMVGTLWHLVLGPSVIICRRRPSLSSVFRLNRRRCRPSFVDRRPS